VNNYEQVKADRDDLLLALKMQQERHKSNWDTNESCYVCDVTRAAISQVERHKQKGGE
jgi:queuine/archaeosine tRNA-ribosyltransferase